QPLLLFTWFGGAVATLLRTIRDRMAYPTKNAFTIETRIEKMAEKANAEPRMIREMKELIVPSASSNPFLIDRVLWLHCAFIIRLSYVLIFCLFTLLLAAFVISLFWAFIPLLLFLPFFLCCSRSIISMVSSYKEADDRILAMTALINRV